MKDEPVIEIFWDEFPEGEDIHIHIDGLTTTKVTNCHNNYYYKYKCKLIQNSEGLFMKNNEWFIQNFNIKTIGRKLYRMAMFKECDSANIILRRINKTRTIIKEFKPISENK